MRLTLCGNDIHDCVVMICKPVGLDKKTLVQKNESFLEATPRIELGNNGFADRGLTTWLWYHIHLERMTGLDSRAAALGHSRL